GSSSPGRMRVWAVRPCVTALSRDRSFPRGDRGPVLRRAFLRLASICLGVVISGVPSSGGRSRIAASHLQGPGFTDLACISRVTWGFSVFIIPLIRAAARSELGILREIGEGG